jgi:protein-disulfide isomerase
MSNQPREPKRAARERLAAERAAQAAKQRRKDMMVRGGLAALVVLVVVGVGLAVIVTHKTKVDTTAARPVGVTSTDGYPTGSATKPVVDLYEDFQCPICQAYESNIGTDIEALATSGKARVVYHSLTFLDSGNVGKAADVLKSSTRAANAAACAQDQGKFVAYHDIVYQNQPTTEGTGFTDTALIAFGKTAGIADMSTFTTCVKDQKYVGFLTQVSAEADTRQVTGTPTFFVNGKMLTFPSAAGTTFADIKKVLLDAVAAAG